MESAGKDEADAARPEVPPRPESQQNTVLGREKKVLEFKQKVVELRRQMNNSNPLQKALGAESSDLNANSSLLAYGSVLSDLGNQADLSIASYQSEDDGLFDLGPKKILLELARTWKADVRKLKQKLFEFRVLFFEDEVVSLGSRLTGMGNQGNLTDNDTDVVPPYRLASLSDYVDRLREFSNKAKDEQSKKEVLELTRRMVRSLDEVGCEVEVEPLGRLLLELRRQVLGAAHPDTLTALTDYADVLQKLGREAEAQVLREEASDLNVKVKDGLLMDSDGDGVADTLLVDSVGDGKADMRVPLASNPLRRQVQEFLATTAFKITSAVTTNLLLITYAIGTGLEKRPSTWLSAFEKALSIVLVGEVGFRWWGAAGFRPLFLLRPIMIVDILNIFASVVLFCPHLAAVYPRLSALKLIRSARILRLLNLFSKESFTQLHKFITKSDKPPSEVTRVGARVIFHLTSIIMITAGFIWEAEKKANTALGGYLDAVYFALTTLTTVGYGDITPVTRIGRIAVMLEMFAAVSLIPYEIGCFFNAVSDGGPQANDKSQLECYRCGLAGHAADARFCRQCGEGLPLPQLE